MENKRLQEARENRIPWKKWGPYLSERQWGTVREDYSDNGDAWNYFTHDHARSRAYRWGEDGLAGISDDKQLLCFALALWNGKDSIIKERLFGLSNSEGNHGEDVKECYFYLDSTPTHAYMKYLYKYPQNAFPYYDLITVNHNRSRSEPEYELIDTGIFKNNRYFDVFVEYAKASAGDILIRITIENRGQQDAYLTILPTLWFRNTWHDQPGETRPVLKQLRLDGSSGLISATHKQLGEFVFAAERAGDLLFTNNETNAEKLFGEPNLTPYVKDGFNNYIVDGRWNAVNPAKTGTKAAAHYFVNVAAGKSKILRLRLTNITSSGDPSRKQELKDIFGEEFDKIFNTRIAEADEFYKKVIPAKLGPDATNVMRQALAGMLWSKQFFYYDVRKWLMEHGVFPSKLNQPSIRNKQWSHMENEDIISMPDKWEYPWYAAWDLAFHVLPLMLVDEDFGKGQLDLILGTEYQHPNGQVPAYEWNFGDVNPPVHAWSVIFSYFLDKAKNGKGDILWLERCFHKLLLNFNWWVNRKDRAGSNVFEGGFLGLDNIGVFDRSSALPTGGYLEQADGTAWMALFSQNMIEMGTQLAMENPAYIDITKKFFEHFLLISSSMIRPDEDGGMWDEADGFFYDVLRLPDGSSHRMKVRSMVGLLPLCAVTVFERDMSKKYPEVAGFISKFLASRPELTAFVHDPAQEGQGGRRLASVLNEQNFKRVLAIMLDEKEFLSPYGIRALSKIHSDHPFVLNIDGQEFKVSYLPGESDNNMFGGNSNWRGPVWMPVNIIIIRALMNYYMYYGNEFQVECPTGSGIIMNLYQVAEDITRRLTAIFLRDENGHRPVFGNNQTFQEDPYWKDLILFHEYFHGDTGAGVGASHQTGWTGVIARVMHLFAETSMEDALKYSKDQIFQDNHGPVQADKK
ncbi:glucosidase [Flavihumibacter fluvii]|uniref:glucosidase n=1 Tax=Flavihumibacter fluvii TaxID=2838157 RepID=UPI001BDE723B|nr:glucosidase [Flavihumibacter fluvii]